MLENKMAVFLCPKHAHLCSVHRIHIALIERWYSNNSGHQSFFSKQYSVVALFSVTVSWAPPRFHLHLVYCRNEVLVLHISSPEALVHSQAAGRYSTHVSCLEVAGPWPSTASLGLPLSDPIWALGALSGPQNAPLPGHGREGANPPLQVGLGGHSVLPKYGTWKEWTAVRKREPSEFSPCICFFSLLHPVTHLC